MERKLKLWFWMDLIDLLSKQLDGGFDNDQTPSSTSYNFTFENLTK